MISRKGRKINHDLTLLKFFFINTTRFQPANSKRWDQFFISPLMNSCLHYCVCCHWKLSPCYYNSFLLLSATIQTDGAVGVETAATVGVEFHLLAFCNFCWLFQLESTIKLRKWDCQWVDKTERTIVNENEYWNEHFHPFRTIKKANCKWNLIYEHSRVWIKFLQFNLIETLW